jgi:hypothetical protein
MEENNFYEQLSGFSNTIISIQYDADELLTFRVSQAQEGEIRKSTDEDISLLFQVNNKIYTLNRQHFNQMSNRELNELFNQLGFDGSRFL